MKLCAWPRVGANDVLSNDVCACAATTSLRVRWQWQPTHHEKTDKGVGSLVALGCCAALTHRLGDQRCQLTLERCHLGSHHLAFSHHRDRSAHRVPLTLAPRLPRVLRSFSQSSSTALCCATRLDLSAQLVVDDRCPTLPSWPTSGVLGSPACMNTYVLPRLRKPLCFFVSFSAHRHTLKGGPWSVQLSTTRTPAQL